MGTFGGCGWEVVADHNAGGTAGRTTILHGLADWMYGDGHAGTSLLRDSLMIVRAVALSRTESPPPFESLEQAAPDIPPSEVTEIHIGNSTMRLNSEVRNLRTGP